MSDDETLDPADDDEYRCWCGEVGTYDSLCDEDSLDDSCAGTGSLNCYCGGDLCVCHHHGATECPGCEECEPDDDSDLYDDD